MQPVNTSRKSCLRRTLSLLVLILFVFVQPGRSAEDARSGAALRSRVFKFKNITSSQARDLLSQLSIGKSYRALNEESLIVTSDSGPDLIKATEVYLFLEQVKKPELRIVMTGNGVESVSLDDFMSTLENLSPGTLRDTPPAGSVNPVIIDYVKGDLVAVGEKAVLDELETSLANYLDTLVAQASEESEFVFEDEDVTEADIELQAVKDAVDGTGQSQMPAQAEIVESEPNYPSLEEIADIAFLEMIPDVNVPMEMDSQDDGMLAGEGEADDSMNEEDDFFSDELLKALEDAEERAIAEAEIAEEAPTSPELAVEAPVEAAGPETEPTEDPMAMLRALLASAGTETPAEVPQPEAAAEEEIEPAEQPIPEKKVDPVQAELDYLRQRLAELESKVSQEESSEPTVEQSKIQSSTTVQTEPQIDPKISQRDIDTIVNVPQDIQLESLVELVGEMLGLNYLYDPAILRGQTVKLKLHGGKIKVGEMYSLLETIFKMKNFAMTREGNLVTVVRAPNASTVMKEVDPVIRTPDEPIEAGNLIVTTLFRLENIETGTAKTMLNSLNLGMSNGFQEVKETNTLMVTDYAYRMARIEKVLSIIDVSDTATQKKYEFRTLKYMKPSEIVPKLKELAGKLQGVSLQVSSGAGASTPTATRTVRTRNPTTGAIETRQVPVTTNTAANRNAATAAAKAPDDAVYIDTDDRTNRILIAGKAEDIALVNELIDALDVPQYDLKTVREYIIQYVEATEVVDVLNELGLASVSVSAPTTNRAAAPRAGVAAPAASAAGAEQPHVSVRPATNSLLVNATEEQHNAIQLVIAHVDVVQKDQRTIRQYEIQFVGAQDILYTLTDLGIISTDSSQSGGSSRAASRPRTAGRTAARTAAQPNAASPMLSSAMGTAVPQALPIAEGGSEVSITAEQPQISILATTNSLLVYATPRQHDAIALVIAHADRQLDAASTPYVVYALENQNPIDLAGVLNDIIRETMQEAAEGRTAGTAKVGTSAAGAASSGTANLPTLEEEKIRIIADEPSYSLIVYANKRNQQWVGELIKELDEYRPQVLLDCTLVEITKDDLFKYELDLVAKGYGRGTGDAGDYTFLRHASDAPAAGASLIDDIGFSNSQYVHGQVNAGQITGFFNSGMIQGLLTAMQRDKYGRVMARPKILVDDNQEGEIKTQNTISVAQVKSTTNIPDSGAAITSTDVSFNDYQAGVTLTIKPHISKGDMLRLVITLNRTDFSLKDPVEITNKDGKVEKYPSPPDRLATDVMTVSTVPDGTTIILGGLETVDQSKTNNKVPILGDLPLIGGLFRDVNDTDKQGKLYVFVKANIIRPGDQVEGLKDINRVSGKYREEFEEMEGEFQGLQDWPGVDPDPMNPKKVLEED